MSFNIFSINRKAYFGNGENVEIGDIIVVVRNGSRALIGKLYFDSKEERVKEIMSFILGEEK